MNRFGIAVALIMALTMPAHASTPANGWVVWASNREDGRHEIYLMQSDGTEVKRLTAGGATGPGWSPDGRWIAYTNTTDSSTHVMRWTGTGDKKVCDGKFEFWMWDGSGLVCRSDDEHHLVNADSGSKTLLFKKSDFSALGSKVLNPGGISHDGRWLAAHTDIYRNGYTGSNGTFKAYHAAILLDLQDKSKIYYFGQGCEPTTPPAGDLVYHVSGGGPCETLPDPYRMKLSDITTRASYAPEIAHADEDWGHEYFPRVSNDNVWLAYGATTGCHDHDTCDYEIYIHKLGAGNADRTRITHDPSNDRWPHLWVGTLPTFCAGDSDCDDGDECTLDSCDPTSESCQHIDSCAPDAGPQPTGDGGILDGPAHVGGDDRKDQTQGGEPGLATGPRLVGGCSMGQPPGSTGSTSGGFPGALLLVLGYCWHRKTRRLRRETAFSRFRS